MSRNYVGFFSRTTEYWQREVLQRNFGTNKQDPRALHTVHYFISLRDRTTVYLDGLLVPDLVSQSTLHTLPNNLHWPASLQTQTKNTTQQLKYDGEEFIQKYLTSGYFSYKIRNKIK